MNTRGLFLSVVVLVAWAAGQARAADLLSNLSASQDGYLEISAFPVSNSCAQGIHVGNGGAAYMLDEIQISIGFAVDSTVLPKMDIYVGDDLARYEYVGSLEMTSPLPPPMIGISTVVYTFNPTSEIVLNSGGYYWICVSVDDPGDYFWNLTEGGPSVAVDDWGYGLNFHSKDGGPWEVAGGTFMTQVSATAVPEPSTWALAGAGLVGLLSRRRVGGRRLK